MAMTNKEWSDEQDIRWEGTVLGDARNYMRELIGDENSLVMHEYRAMKDWWELTAYTIIGNTRCRVDAELRLTGDEVIENKAVLTDKLKLQMAEDAVAGLMFTIERCGR